MLAYMANIPERIAYCRENPYELLTIWLPDKEPYSYIQHQVERDLQLVNAIGARADNKRLQVKFNEAVFNAVKYKLIKENITFKRYIIIHPGVSEKKRISVVFMEGSNQQTQSKKRCADFFYRCSIRSKSY